MRASVVSYSGIAGVPEGSGKDYPDISKVYYLDAKDNRQAYLRQRLTFVKEATMTCF